MVVNKTVQVSGSNLIKKNVTIQVQRVLPRPVVITVLKGMTGSAVPRTSVFVHLARRRFPRSQQEWKAVLMSGVNIVASSPLSPESYNSRSMLQFSWLSPYEFET